MKKRLLALLIIGMLMFSGCEPIVNEAEETLKIYASFYPVYSLSDMILGSIPDIELKCLVQPQDDCLRLYDLSDWDASVLAYDADAVIIAGNGLESFENALYTFGDSGPAVITAAYSVPLYEHSAPIGIENSTGHLDGENPHIYMSVSGAREMVSVIGSSVAELCPELKPTIDEAIIDADASFDALESHIGNIRIDTEGTSVILMNEALIYTALDYGLDVAYQYDRESGTTLYGSSLDSAVEAFKKTGAEVVLIEKQAPAELTDALSEEGFTVICIDIMSSYHSDDSMDYISVQYKNAAAIAEALIGTERE